MSFVDNLLHLLAPLTANCREFQAHWDRALPLAAVGISGCWDGEWISEVTGHRGRLRCVAAPVDADVWRMYFRGDYSKVFRACYATEFHVKQQTDGWTFSGGADLGALAGGVYEYEGSATLEALTCSYKSARDHGTFVLARVRRQRPNDQLPNNSA